MSNIINKRSGPYATDRLTWMDSLRGFAIVLVLVQHSVTIPQWDGYEGSVVLGTVNAFFQPYRMPLLLVLSGLLLPKSLRKPLGVYFSGKARRILWPLMLWTLVIWALSPPSLDDPSSIVGPRHLWFLVVLAGCYAVSPLTKWAPPWLMALMAASIPVLISADESSVLNLAGYVAFFMIGAAATDLLPRWQDVNFAFPALLGIIAFGWGVAQVSGLNLEWLPSPLMSVIGIASLLWLAPHLPNLQWAQWIGRHSMVYYIAHVPIMIVAWGGLRGVGVTQREVISLILLAMATMMCLAMARARWAQWLFQWPTRG